AFRLCFLRGIVHRGPTAPGLSDRNFHVGELVRKESGNCELSPAVSAGSVRRRNVVTPGAAYLPAVVHQADSLLFGFARRMEARRSAIHESIRGKTATSCVDSPDLVE